MFDFEWTQRRDANEADQQKGIEAAEKFVAAAQIDPKALWSEYIKEDVTEETVDAWIAIESTALSAMCDGWIEQTENASLVWR